MVKLLQTGLYCKNESDLDAFADRVSGYNKSKGFIVVEMEGRESEPDDIYGKAHWKVTLEFKSRAYAKDFWTDPEYQKEVLV